MTFDELFDDSKIDEKYAWENGKSVAFPIYGEYKIEIIQSKNNLYYVRESVEGDSFVMFDFDNFDSAIEKTKQMIAEARERLALAFEILSR